MKGVILAGGSGTRLYPTTQVINKHFVPIYDKPMIYYPMSVMMMLKIRDVALVVNPQDKAGFERLFGHGEKLGMHIEYLVQQKPNGLAEGLVLAEDFIGEDSICYMLGDNIFFGHDLPNVLGKAKAEVEGNGGAYVFAYPVKDPERFGIVAFNDRGEVQSIEEKPKEPKSNWAVVGLYFYDKHAVKVAKGVKPSERGEVEITSVNEAYLRGGKLKVGLLGRGFAWFDAGTYDSFIETSEFVATLEKRTGLMISCLEEIAYKNGWISIKELMEIAEELKNTDYGEYLKEVIEDAL
ncbi:glucose-1-phosphate thymidylyltransferase RfbA [Coprothermobacter platensis]|uniref:glucose-1-phosphate thymidylyltransferase RfbA n=1 Tax=Coprothermobacter platensis TaxID=108819 RepID=UPI000368F36D|nr:glucose-1-phosphate thymidylyltransferase RfbA [Coprothermobacter platensis]